MSKIVQQRTNTGTGAYWLRRLVEKAKTLGKYASWRDVKEGYLLQAKRTGKLRSATLLDLPHKMLYLGIHGGPLLFGVAGESGTRSNYGQSARVPVAGSRDAFLFPGVGETKAREDVTGETSIYQALFVGYPPPENFVVFDYAERLQANFEYASGVIGARAKDSGVTAWHMYTTPDVYPIEQDGTQGQVVFPFMPMSPERQLGIIFEFPARAQTSLAVTIDEAFVASATGGYQFVARLLYGGGDGTVIRCRPFSLPWCAGEKNEEHIRIVVPVTKASNDGGDVAVDKGNPALFVVLIQYNEETQTQEAQSLSLWPFPSTPQFEIIGGAVTPEFTGSLLGQPAGLALTNFGDLVVLDDGSFVYYGATYRTVTDDSALNDSDYVSTNMTTGFVVQSTPTGNPNWSVFYCAIDPNTENSNSAYRRVNTTADDMEVIDQVTALKDQAGGTWGVYFLLETKGSNRVNFATAGYLDGEETGDTGRIYSTRTIILNGTSVVASGLPDGVKLIWNSLSDLSDTTDVLALVPAPPVFGYLKNNPVTVWTDTEDRFGFCFFVYRETDNSLAICSWDTVEGFALWDYDLSAMDGYIAEAQGTDSLTNYGRAFMVRTPSLHCYTKARVVDGEVIRQPRFTACVGKFNGLSEDALPGATFLVVGGVATKVIEAAALAAVPIGNDLQNTPLNNLYRG